MRARVKALAEWGLATLGPAAVSRRAFRRRALVLAYHNVLPAGAGGGADASLHLPIARFRAHLDLVQRHTRVVSLAEALAPAAPDDAAPRVAITFDDAYRGAIAAAIPELARRGLPATVFVTPGMLGGPGFWWDLVTGPGGQLPEAFREAALAEARGEQARVLALAERHGLRVAANAPAAAQPVTEEELREAAATHPGLGFGAHTAGHPNLARLGGAELLAELGPPLAWLRERLPRVEPWLAYPYGLSSPEAEAAAAAAGYTLAFRVTGGWLPEGTRDAMTLPRLNVPAGMSDDGLALRLAGLVG